MMSRKKNRCARLPRSVNQHFVEFKIVVGLLRDLDKTSLAAFTTDFIVRAEKPCGIIAVYHIIVAGTASTARMRL